MKTCPWCAEEIQDAARVCKHCGRDVTSDMTPGPAAPVASVPAQPSKKRGGFGRSLGTGCLVVIVLVMVLAVIGGSQGTQTTSVNSAPNTPPDKSQSKVLDPRLLVADPNSYRGQNIYLQGKALNVDQHSDYTWVQLLAQVPGKTEGSTESIVIEFRPKTAVLKDECYRVYGIVGGTQKVTRTLTGASNEVPYLNGYAYESAPQGQFKFGCAAP